MSLTNMLPDFGNLEEAEELFEELLIKLRAFERDAERATLGSFSDQCRERIEELDFEDEQDAAEEEEDDEN